MLAPAPWALAIVERGALTQLIVRGEGARDLVPLPGLHAKALADYARTLGVGALIVLERRAIAELSAEIEASLRPDQDAIAQGLIALRALKKHAGRGIWTEPPLLDLLPAPTY